MDDDGGGGGGMAKIEIANGYRFIKLRKYQIK